MAPAPSHACSFSAPKGPTMNYETILLEQKEPGIWLLTVNRPKSLNALAPQVLYDIASAVAKVNGDAAARALMITGAGDKAFVAGADIAAMSGMTPIEGRAFALEGHATLRSLELSPLQRAILDAVREHGTVAASLLMVATGANRNTLKDNLRRLVDRGLIERLGERRGSIYRLASGEPGVRNGDPRAARTRALEGVPDS